MSIKDNFPSVGPSLSLNFARSKTLDPRITFSRASTSGDATYMDANGLIVTAAADEPRFDHNYDNGVVKSLGLLVEEQRTNLIRYNTKHDESYWVNNGNNSSETINTTETSSPDGTNNATKLFGNNGVTGRQSIYQGVSVTSGTTYTFSVFLKQGQRRYASIWFDTTNISEGAYYGSASIIDLQTGTLATGSQTNIVPYPNGWYCCYVTATPTATGNVNMQVSVGSPNNNVSGYIANGDGSSGIYIWGHQVEAGEFPTSYIPTSAGISTRGADNVTMTGTNFSDWYNQDEGTVYVSQKLKGVQDDSRNNLVYKINGGGGSDYFYNTKSGDKNIFIFGDGGTNYSRFQDNTDSTDTKTAFAYDVSGDDFKPYHDGIEVTNETISNTPSVTSHTQLELGASSGAKYCGHIQQFAYYPKRLTNTQLQNLTK